MLSEKDRLIMAISEWELLLDFMDKYDLYCLKDATEEQLREYFNEKQTVH